MIRLYPAKKREWRRSFLSPEPYEVISITAIYWPGFAICGKILPSETVSYNKTACIFSYRRIIYPGNSFVKLDSAGRVKAEYCGRGNSRLPGNTMARKICSAKGSFFFSAQGQERRSVYSCTGCISPSSPNVILSKQTSRWQPFSSGNLVSGVANRC